MSRITLCNHEEHYACEQLELLQAELDKYRWIPVSEGLPKKNGKYLLLTERYGVLLCYKGNENVKDVYHFGCQIRYASHYMPVPEGV